MKTGFALLISCSILASCGTQKPLKFNKTQLVDYLVNDVMLKGRTGGGLMLFPLGANEIGKDDPTREVQYWQIMGKYFKGMSREELKTVINQASWLDKPSNATNIHLYYPKQKPVTPADYEYLQDRYKWAPIFFVSNPVYSKDGSTCIIFVKGYQQGAYTVEITKDESGKWAWNTRTTDWIE